MDAQGLRGVFHSLAHSVQRCGSRTRGESCKLAGQRNVLSFPNYRNHKNRCGQLDITVAVVVVAVPCDLAQETAVLGRRKWFNDSLDNLDAVGDHVGLDIILVVEALEVGQSFAIGGGIESNSVVCGCDK